MSVETMMDGLPVWDKKIAEWLKPVEPYVVILLLLTAILCVAATLHLKPQYQLLFLAFLWSP